MKKLTKKDWITIAIAVVLLGVVIYASILLIPFIQSLSYDDARNTFKAYVESLGIWGYFLIIGLIIVQIVIAFIPGEPQELLCGMMYGWFWGLVVALIACFIGSSLVFLLVKKFGKPFVNKFFSDEKIAKFKFLNDEKKLEKTVFILFFIVGSPKDLLTYIVPLTKMKYKHFILIVTFARIPSIITSTIAGAGLASGQLNITIIAFAVTAIITIVGLIINHIIEKKHKEKEISAPHE